jgi:hypothetical protein
MKSTRIIPFVLICISIVLFASLVSAQVDAPYLWQHSGTIGSPFPVAEGRFSGNPDWNALDISDDDVTIVVGAPYEHRGGFQRGVVYVYRRSPGGTLPQLESIIEHPNQENGAAMGRGVRISGDGSTIVASSGIMAASRLLVFRRDTAGWVLLATLPNANRFTTTLDLSFNGDVIAAGEHDSYDDEISTWQFSQGAYSHVPVTVPVNSRFLHGYRAVTVSEDGGTILVGNYGADDLEFGSNSEAGAAFVLSRVGSEWAHGVTVTKLVPSDRFGTDNFGYGAVMSNDGSVVFAAAPRKQIDADHSGRIYRFDRGGATWAPGFQSETETLSAPSVASYTMLGRRLALSANNRFLAASSHGAMWMFDVDRHTWTSLPTPASPPCSASWSWPYGSQIAAVSSDGRTLVVGHGTACVAPSTVAGGAMLVFTRRDIVPPVANDDTYTYAFEAGSVTSPPGVLANDETLAPMTATLVSSASHGTLTFRNDGGFTYVPAQGFVGVDQFTYRASNLIGDGNTATVRLSVQSPTTPQPPTAVVAERVDGNRVTLRWTPAVLGPSATRYVVEVGLGQSDTLSAVVTASSAPGLTLDFPNGTFMVRVRAERGAQRSRPSENVRVHLGETIAPSAPPGTYTLAIRAVNGAGVSPPSNPITLTLPGPCSGAPAAPVVTGHRVGSQVFLQWGLSNSSVAATGYIVEVAGTAIGVATITTPSRALSAVAPGGIYRVAVIATNACGHGTRSEEITITVP